MARLLGREARLANAQPRVTRRLAFHVPRGATCELPRVEGRMTVHCRGGSVWITHDGDPRDVVLQADQSHPVDREARLTVHAMAGDAALELQYEAG